MEKKDENKIESLDSSIVLVQLDEFMDDFDKSMHKSIKHDLITAAIVVTPILVGVVGYVVFKTPIVLTVGCCMTASAAIVKNVRDMIKDSKNLEKELKKPNYNNDDIDEDNMTPEQVLDRGIVRKKGEDFYTPEMKYVIEYDKNHVESESERKYREAVEKQQAEINNRIRLVTKENKKPLSKDDVIKQIVHEIDVYYMAYKLPDMNISNTQWDIYFDTCYAFLEKRGKTDEFFRIMSTVCSCTLASVLVHNRKQVTIDDFIKGLDYLKIYGIKEKESKVFQNVLKSQMPSSKVTSLTDYINKNGGQRK